MNDMMTIVALQLLIDKLNYYQNLLYELENEIIAALPKDLLQEKKPTVGMKYLWHKWDKFFDIKNDMSELAEKIEQIIKDE